MQVEGIKGDVTAEGYSEWIELTSVQWGVGRAISAPVGGASDREASAPSFSELTTTKMSDKTSPLLLAEAAVGRGKLVEIHFTRTDGGGKLFAYQKIKLYNVMFSGFSQSSGGDRPSESLSLNYTKIEFRYIPTAPDGKPQPDVTFIYDLALGRSL